MNTDKLVEGPFGSNACYEQQFEHQGQIVTTWMCFGSGFTTSTLMTKDSELVKQTLESLPELYKDLMHIDKENRVWFPATITLPEQGMIFVDGTDKRNWKWAAVKAIPLESGDKKISQDQTYKMDMKNVKHFAQNDFMEACDFIQMFRVV